MRKKIAAGNWKMNLSLTEAQKLVSEIVHMFKDEYRGDAEVIFGPSFPYLPSIHHLTKHYDRIHLAAQNMHEAESGAFTGEVSAEMLDSVGVSHVILGHSERRQYFQESNALLAKKADQALAHGLQVIFCIGETLEQREAGKTLEVVRTQLQEGIFHLRGSSFSRVIIAYEPIWAIGTGVTASPEQAQEVHAYIRKLIDEKYGISAALDTSILYGGSVKPDNAAELFAKPDIDGGLVGGASLKSRDFMEIIKAL
jgi:triosephosphate isomerase